MINTQTRTIDGFAIEVSQLTAMKALRMSARLGRLFGAPLAKAVSTIDINNVGASDAAALGAALATLFEGVSENELEEITKILLAAATVNGKPMFPAVFDLEFAGKVDTIYKVIAFALEVNYGSFFDVLRAFGVKARAAEKPGESTSPPISK